MAIVYVLPLHHGHTCQRCKEPLPLIATRSPWWALFSPRCHHRIIDWSDRPYHDTDGFVSAEAGDLPFKTIPSEDGQKGLRGFFRRLHTARVRGDNMLETAVSTARRAF